MSIETYVPNSTKIIHTTEVDFIGRAEVKDIRLVQHDSIMPVIAVDLFMNKERYSIPNDPIISAKVRWGQYGNTIIYKDILGCNSSRDTIYVMVESDMTLKSGKYNPVIELVESSNRVASSAFGVIVDNN